MENLQVILSIVVAALTILGAVTGSFSKLWQWVRRALLRPEPGRLPVPKQTIRLVPPPDTILQRWSEGSTGNRPAMHVVGAYNVTNITHYAIVLPVAKLRKPSVWGAVLILSDRSAVHDTPIPPAGSARIQFMFWIDPPVRRKEPDILTRDAASEKRRTQWTGG